MIPITLKDGFTVNVRDDIEDDWDLMSDFANLETNSLAIFRVVHRMFDKDQYEALKKHAEKDGHVSAQAMMGYIQEIFESDALKNLVS